MSTSRPAYLQRDARAVLGDRRHLLQRLVAALALGAEADLVGIGGDHVGGRPQVHLAGLIDDHGVAGRHPLDEAARLADRGDAQGPRDDGDVTLRAALLQDEPAQPGAVVVEQFGRAHVAGDRDGRAAARRGRGRCRGRRGCAADGRKGRRGRAGAPASRDRSAAACERVFRSARARRPSRRQPAEHGLAQPPLPALVVGEHAVGLEHLAVLTGGGKVLVLEHLVECGLELLQGGVEAVHLLGRIVGDELVDDDARLVHHRVAERDALRHRLAADEDGGARENSMPALAPATAPETGARPRPSRWSAGSRRPRRSIPCASCSARRARRAWSRPAGSAPRASSGRSLRPSPAGRSRRGGSGRPAR